MCPNTVFQKLFEPGTIGAMPLKNRVIMEPMVTNFATDTGAVTERMIEYYEYRALKGISMIVVEAACIDPPVGKALASQLCIHRDSLITGHNRLVGVIHRGGALAVLQLHHAGRSTTLKNTDGQQTVAPSAVIDKKWGLTPKELTVSEIEDLVEKFAQAAVRARTAEYDGVEIHAGHGYLVGQFLSPYTNKRTDEYGGDFTRRMKFLRDIVTRVKELCGPNYPILLKMSAEELVEGGLTIEDTKPIAKKAEELGVVAVDVSRGIWETAHFQSESMAQPQGAKVHLAAAIKGVVGIPVIVAGNIKEPEFAEKVLKESKADFIGLGRALLTDPHWLTKARAGRSEKIRKCYSCKLCSDRLIRGLPICCACNPTVGREREFAQVKVAAVKKTVMVIGGGTAGMEAAHIAASRGHKVSLYEREPDLGNIQMLLASLTPHKGWIGWLRDDLIRKVQQSKVKVHLGIEVDTALVEQVKPDVVIVATGAEPFDPGIPGSKESSKVCQAWDVLKKKVEIKPEELVAVLGGGLTGCETAEFLAEKGIRVTIITRSPLSQLGSWHNVLQGQELAARALANEGIRVLPEHDVEQVMGNGIIIVNKKDGSRKLLEVDRLVLARGAKPLKKIAEGLEGKVPEIYTIGDCKEPRDIYAAIHEATFIAIKI